MVEHYLDRLARTINENWDKPALTDFYLTEDGSAQDTSRGNHYTYGEMYAEILRLGEVFAALGLKQGDHIAICGANSAHWAIAYLAIAAYQGVVVTVLHSQATEDIAHQIDFSDAKALFTDEDLWEELKSQSLPQIKHVIDLADWYILHGEDIQISNIKSKITNRDCHFSTGEINDLAMICFTSGSTGVSKGVMLSYRSISNNVSHFVKSYLPVSQDNAVYMSFLPYGHVFGLLCDFLTQINIGKSINLISPADAPRIEEILIFLKPYVLTSSPMVIMKLFKRHGIEFFKSLSQFCGLLALGGSLIPEEIEYIHMECKIPLFIGYGTSETGPMISGGGENILKYHRPNSCDRAVQGMSVRIASNGEILVKGENVMLGYYKDSEATARKIDKDGWLHTGDKGHLDEDGYLYVEGRLEQDMIVLPNGENIHPEDIERKINALPEVKESIVLARDGKLVAIVVADTDIRRHVLRTINPELPLYSQLYDVEITDVPLPKTEKQTIKRYLYK